MKPIRIFFIIYILLNTFNAISCSQRKMYDAAGDDARIQYVGRVDQSVKGQTSFSYSAVEMNVAFSGSMIKIFLAQESSGEHNNYIDIWIDGEYKGKRIIEGKEGQLFYYTSDDFSKQKHHTLKMVKRTEAFVGKIIVYSVSVDSPGDLHAYTYQAPLRIQFIGNSITCGYGNELSLTPPDGNPLTGFHAENENAYMSYAGITARNLKAQSLYVSYSGIGVYRNFDGDTVKTMPNIYDRIHPDLPSSPKWNPSLFIPDIIVINLGTNDYYLESQNQPLNDSVFVQTYIRFVQKIINDYPEAKIICANGSILNDGWPAGKQCWTRIQNNLKDVCLYFQAKGKAEIYPFFFTPQSGAFGEDYHPTIATHTKMAEELTAFITSNVLK